MIVPDPVSIFQLFQIRLDSTILRKLWVNARKFFGSSKPSGRIRIQDKFFDFFVIGSGSVCRVLGIKYKLKELRMNVYDTFGGVGLALNLPPQTPPMGRPSDNERRWRRFELYECYPVIITNRFSPARRTIKIQTTHCGVKINLQRTPKVVIKTQELSKSLGRFVCVIDTFIQPRLNRATNPSRLICVKAGSTSR